MKRRSLLKRLGLAAVAGVALPAVAQKVVADAPKATKALYTVRTGLPAAYWRNINAAEHLSMLNETNQVLADMTWKEAN